MAQGITDTRQAQEESAREVGRQLATLAVVKFGSQRQAAAAVGVDVSTLCRLFRGQQIATLSVVARMAAAVGRSVVSTSAGCWLLA